MVRAYVTRAAVLVVVGLVATGCAGDMPVPDVQSPDKFAGDTAKVTEQGSGSDLLPAPDTRTVDTQPAAVDRGPAGDRGTGPCAAWSSWTCEADAVLLCKAFCAAGPLHLSCINSGSCVCGVSTSPCGTFTGNAPCDVCRQAVEADCCK